MPWTPSGSGATSPRCSMASPWKWTLQFPSYLLWAAKQGKARLWPDSWAGVDWGMNSDRQNLLPRSFGGMEEQLYACEFTVGECGNVSAAERRGRMGHGHHVAQHGLPGQDRCGDSLHYVRVVGGHHD